MSTQNTRAEELITKVVDGVQVTMTARQLDFAHKKIGQVFSVYSGVFQQSVPSGVDAYLGYQALGYLRKKFGADFEMFHGAPIKEVHDFILRVKDMEDVSIYVDDETHVIIMMHMKTRHGLDMKVNLQIFMADGFATSAVTINILSQDGFRDIEKDLDATIKYYENLQKNDVPGSQKAKMVKPNFIAEQKLAFGANVVRRKSSVQLSADYAQAAYSLLKSVGQTFSTNMNILQEMIAVKNKLGITEEEEKMFTQAASGLQALALNNIKKIDAYRETIKRRAIEELGKRTFKNSLTAAELHSVSTTAQHWESEQRRHGYKLWNESLTTGDQKSLISEVMTMAEAEEIARMNDENNTELALQLKKACEHLGENALMKMAVTEYIRKYADPEENETGFSVLWNIFEDGIVQALHLYENMDKDVFVYNAPVVEFSAFFVNANADTRLQGLEEIKQLKEGDKIVVKPDQGFMALHLNSGVFYASNKKTLTAFPVVPEGHHFEATVVSVNPTQKATSGLSIRIKDVVHVSPTPEPEENPLPVAHAFQVTDQAYGFMREIFAERGSYQDFLVQEFYVWNGVLHMAVQGTLMPISHVNEALVHGSEEPVRMEGFSVEYQTLYCR